MASLDYESPCGPIRLTAEGGKLCGVRLGARGRAAQQPVSAALRRFAAMLDGYFRGQGMDCRPADLGEGEPTALQRHVRLQLLAVGFGHVVTYGELARRCGRMHGARAVGQALGANPLPIFVPCHRVVRAGGRPGGFAAGEAWKRSLLEHEGWSVQDGRIVRAHVVLGG